MKRLICILAAVAALALNAGTGATIEWVTNYVNKAISQSTAELRANENSSYSNGVTSASYVVDGYEMSFTYEDADVMCFKSQDVTSAGTAAGLTNGVVWVYNPVTSNFTSKAFASIVDNHNGTWSWSAATAVEDTTLAFKNASSNLLFNAVRILLQPSVANTLK